MANDIRCKKQWSAEEVEEILKLINQTNIKSLDDEIRNDDEETLTTLKDTVVDNSPGPDEVVETDERKQYLLSVINKLPPRQALVITMRYGLDDGKPKTLEEIGQHFGVTRERIRQIEEKGMSKLVWLIKIKDGHKNINDV